MILRLASRRLPRAIRNAPLYTPLTSRTNARVLTNAILNPPRTFTSSARRWDEARPFQTQLDDPVAASFLTTPEGTLDTALPTNPQTLTEKIVQRFSIGLSEGKKVRSGDYVTLSPHHCMTHDNSWPVATKFMSIGASKIHNNRQVVMTLDHDVQNKSATNLKKYEQIESFAKLQGVDFYPAGHGIGHQVMVEEGYAWPGTLVVASDSHSNMYGGVGCLGTPVVRTDAASIWATGKTWWQIPPVARVTFSGVLPEGVSGKDVIVALCGLFNNDEVLNHAIEFTGSPETMRSLPVDYRLTIANMTTEWGALSGLFPIDSLLQSWLRGRATEVALYDGSSPTPTRVNHKRIAELVDTPLAADPNANYAKEVYLDLSTLCPYVAGPNSVKVATPLQELEAQNIKVDKAYLVSCTNSRRSDIAAAADVFRDAAATNGGKIPSIASHTTLYIAAASLQEQRAAEDDGDWKVLLDAGAIELPSGCGPCIGLGTGLLEPGEVGVSASNRNFKGRMGSTEAKAYLASPEIVAASALNGYLSGPGLFKDSGKEIVRGMGLAPAANPIEESLDLLEMLLIHTENIIRADEKAQQQPAAVEGESKAAPVEDSSPVSSSTEEGLTEILPGFPEQITGEIVFCDADNINTDGIYPGKYTYQDNVSTEKMAEVVMENYDREFASITKPGDIVVAGYNFGCGSSREQAATALLAKGIPLVVSGSFGNIFSRNSINNGLLGVEVPKLVSRLRSAFGGEARSASVSPTVRTGWTLTWDIRRSIVRVTEKKADGSVGEEWEEKVGSMPPNVQDIVAKGGLEKWVKSQLDGQ